MLDFSELNNKVFVMNFEEAADSFLKTVNDAGITLCDFEVKQALVNNMNIATILFYNSEVNIELQNTLIGVDFDGVKLPFVVCPDWYNPQEYCIIPIYNDLSEVHDLYMEKMVNAKPINEFARYPIIERPTQNTFREWLSTCQQKYYSHFFGEKSKRVSWKLISCMDSEIDKVYRDTLYCHVQHNQQFIANFGSDNMFQHLITNMMPWVGYVNNTNTYMICGYDEEENKYIAAMYVYVYGKRAYLQTIATSKEDKYKPYGLVLAAHYAAIRDLIWTDENEKFQQIESIDLGCNFDNCMSYKDSMHPTYYPIKNVPNFTSFKELISYL